MFYFQHGVHYLQNKISLLEVPIESDCHSRQSTTYKYNIPESIEHASPGRNSNPLFQRRFLINMGKRLIRNRFAKKFAQRHLSTPQLVLEQPFGRCDSSNSIVMLIISSSQIRPHLLLVPRMPFALW
jgi:hypothetical protein